MKPSKRKNAIKDKTIAKKQDDCACLIVVGVLALIALIGGVVYYAQTPKFDAGDCVLNRMSEVKKITNVDADGEEYRLRSMKFSDIGKYTGNYYYMEDYDSPTEFKEIDFVDEKYVEVPCDR